MNTNFMNNVIKHSFNQANLKMFNQDRNEEIIASNAMLDLTDLMH